MSRLHDLYDRLHDRIAQYRDPAPRRADEPDEEIAHTTLSVDQLAYGEDASDTSAGFESDTMRFRVSPPAGDDHFVVDDDDATDTGENWVENLELHTVEDGPPAGQEVDPDRDLERQRRR